MSGPGGGGTSQDPTVSMSRAERFEDEKRRIMESCFSKKDPDGSSMLKQHEESLLLR